MTGDFTWSPQYPVNGQTITFTASISGGTPPYTYTWEVKYEGSGTGTTLTGNPASLIWYRNYGDMEVKLSVNDADRDIYVIIHNVKVD